jgi:hypothetical protein
VISRALDREVIVVDPPSQLTPIDASPDRHVVHRARFDEGNGLTRSPLGQRAARRLRTLSTVNRLGPGGLLNLRWDRLVCPYRLASANISAEPHGSPSAISPLARFDLEFF